jgi:DNA (cytosine-5)-methyltransferase 1
VSRINVIDLFAGPGGLGEGFSAYNPSLLGKKGCDRIFKVRFSIEMDDHAHRTLLIRSFLRQFEDDYPHQYYEHYRGNISFDEFRAIPELQDAWRAASEEVGHGPLKMGEEQDDRVIEKRISELMSEANGEENWIVIGGPPCQAFSSVGRVRNMAKPDYRQSSDERIYAYIEYLKILDQVRPDCFILENVEGMLHTAPDGERIFPTIHRQLHDPSAALVELGKKPQRQKKKRHSKTYRIVSATGVVPDSAGGQEFLVPIADYGVPQDRRRVILIGIRSDFVQDSSAGELPRLAKFVDRSGNLARVSVGEAIGNLPRIRSKISLRNFFGEKTKEGGRRLSQIDCYMNGFLANRAEESGKLKAAAVRSMDGLLEVPRTDRIGGSSSAERLIRDKYPDYRDSLRRIRKSGQLPTN